MKELLGSLLASGEIVKIRHKPARGFSVDIYGIGKDAEEPEDAENNKVVNDDLTTFQKKDDTQRGGDEGKKIKTDSAGTNSDHFEKLGISWLYQEGRQWGGW